MESGGLGGLTPACAAGKSARNRCCSRAGCMGGLQFNTLISTELVNGRKHCVAQQKWQGSREQGEGPPWVELWVAKHPAKLSAPTFFLRCNPVWLCRILVHLSWHLLRPVFLLPLLLRPCLTLQPHHKLPLGRADGLNAEPALFEQCHAGQRLAGAFVGLELVQADLHPAGAGKWRSGASTQWPHLGLYYGAFGSWMLVVPCVVWQHEKQLGVLRQHRKQLWVVRQHQRQ